MELLLVEDEDRTAYALAALLRKLGFKVSHAPNLMTALEELVRLPDVVVLDLPLSDGGGLEVLKMIRDAGLDCRIAVLTSTPGDPTMIADIQALKPTAIFQKPLNFEDFGAWLCDLFP